MSKKTPVLNRQYTREFKVEAVRLAESVGGNEGQRSRDTHPLIATPRPTRV
jgi:transposase-like protein